jgi:hypothetical protein
MGERRGVRKSHCARNYIFYFNDAKIEQISVGLKRDILKYEE